MYDNVINYEYSTIYTNNNLVIRNMLAFILVILFLSIPLIAYVDSKIFEKINKCANCGYPLGLKDYIWPCIVEASLFAFGIMVGINIKT